MYEYQFKLKDITFCRVYVYGGDGEWMNVFVCVCVHANTNSSQVIWQ